MYSDKIALLFLLCTKENIQICSCYLCRNMQKCWKIWL